MRYCTNLAVGALAMKTQEMHCAARTAWVFPMSIVNMRFRFQLLWKVDVVRSRSAACRVGDTARHTIGLGKVGCNMQKEKQGKRPFSDSRASEGENDSKRPVTY